MDTQTPASPADPNAPAKHTLPSGKVVEIRSHRTLLGSDGAAVLAAQTAAGAQGVVDMRNELIRRMVSEIEPGTGGAPTLDGTIDAVLAQRIDDYRALYNATTDAYLLVIGASVVPNLEAWEDPTGPTRDTSDSKPPLEDADPS